MTTPTDEMVERVAHPDQPQYVDGRGVRRFKENPIVRYLLDKGGIDMNALALRGFSAADEAHFAQLIGYSVSGWSDLSYVSDADWQRVTDAPLAVLPAPPPRDPLTPMERALLAEWCAEGQGGEADWVERRRNSVWKLLKATEGGLIDPEWAVNLRDAVAVRLRVDGFSMEGEEAEPFARRVVDHSGRYPSELEALCAAYLAAVEATAGEDKDEDPVVAHLCLNREIVHGASAYCSAHNDDPISRDLSLDGLLALVNKPPEADDLTLHSVVQAPEPTTGEKHYDDGDLVKREKRRLLGETRADGYQAGYTQGVKDGRIASDTTPRESVPSPPPPAAGRARKIVSEVSAEQFRALCNAVQDIAGVLMVRDSHWGGGTCHIIAAATHEHIAELLAIAFPPPAAEDAT